MTSKNLEAYRAIRASIANWQYKRQKGKLSLFYTTIKILNRLASGEGLTYVGKKFGLHEALIKTLNIEVTIGNFENKFK